jgi:hypothetical protein
MSLGPAALVRSVPDALGRTPADELVIVGVSNLAPTAASVIAVELFAILTDRDAEDAAAAVNAAVTQTRADGSTKAVVLVYADDAFSSDSTPARYGATAVVTAEAAGLGVLDAIAVANGRWRSYECTDVACCPPEGHPIGEGR